MSPRIPRSIRGILPSSSRDLVNHMQPTTMRSNSPVKIGSLVIMRAGFLVAVFSFLLLGFPAAAEDPPQGLAFDANGLLKIAAPVNEVNLLLTVTDARGKFVGDMTKEDLQFLDNHLPPEQLNYFLTRTDLPLRVTLLLDISSSIRQRFPFEQQAANAFLKRILRPAVDQAAIITFGDGVGEVQPMTNSLETLQGAVNRVKPGGETAMYDGLIAACASLEHGSLKHESFKHENDRENVRRVIILITDGADTASHAPLKAALRATLQAEAVVLAIDANILSEKHSRGTAILEDLTRSSGGFIVPAREQSDFKTAFRAVEAILRNQYAVGYKPSGLKWDGGFRAIEVASRRRGLKVHCREGYFASALSTSEAR
jgi:Ca-activated chloride channel family protein